MRKRTQGREYCLQILYQIDITAGETAKVMADFWEKYAPEINEETRKFTEELTRGIVGNLGGIDAEISRYATNWKLERMAVIDRNILRIGCYELIHRDDIPPKVSINESVELAKKFSGVKAGQFVNGILDKIRLELKKEL